MDLFNELKSSSLEQIVAALNRAVQGEAVTREELVQQLSLFAKADQGRREFDEEGEEKLLDLLFQKQPFRPALNQPVPILPLQVEKEWLRQLLGDPHASSLLSPALLAKLHSLFGQVPDYSSVWRREYLTEGTRAPWQDQSYCERLRTIQKALQEQVMVAYASYDDAGNTYEGQAAPFKLEYSFRTDSYYFIMWNEQKQWTFKSDVATITRLELLKLPVPEGTRARAEAYVQGLRLQTEPLVLHLREKNNALERCFALFASYDKEVEQVAPKEFLLKIFYYGHFDEEELFLSILSLGSAVEVVAPSRVRSRVIEDLQKRTWQADSGDKVPLNQGD